MQNKALLLCSLFITVLSTSCMPPLMTLYVPPSPHAVTTDLHTVILAMKPETARGKVLEAMSGFDWLKKSVDGLNYTGNVQDASQYADCGYILTHPNSASRVNKPYAGSQSEFMGMGPGSGSSDILMTNLAVNLQVNITQVPEGSKINVLVRYVLNREHIERRTMFGIESRPPEKNSPIQFDTLTTGNAPDGTMCISNLTLEQRIIRAISGQ